MLEQDLARRLFDGPYVWHFGYGASAFFLKVLIPGISEESLQSGMGFMRIILDLSYMCRTELLVYAYILNGDAVVLGFETIDHLMSFVKLFPYRIVDSKDVQEAKNNLISELGIHQKLTAELLASIDSLQKMQVEKLV